MAVFASTLALLGLVLCLLFAWLWKRQERERVARQWVERERLLDRRFRTASAKDVRRRRGLPRGRPSSARLTHSGRWRS
jgi:hypothetical protein